MNNRLIEYDMPTEDEIVSRLLSTLHKAMDEQFPNSVRHDSSRRFSRTEFSTVSEDTIIEQSPGPAVGDPISEAPPPIHVPPPPRAEVPPKPVMEVPLPQPQKGQTAPSPRRTSRAAPETSLPLPSEVSNLSKPMSRTRVAATATNTGIDSSVAQGNGGKGFSLKLFAFLFAILIGIAVGSVFFLFWVR